MLTPEMPPVPDMPEIPKIIDKKKDPMRDRRTFAPPSRLAPILCMCLAGLSCLVGRPRPARADSAAPSAAVMPDDLPPGPSLPESLSLQDALRLFRAHGLDLLIAEAAVQNAEGDVRVAGAIINPQVYGNFLKTFYNPADKTTCPDGSCSDTGFSVGISDQNALEDVISGKRGLRRRVANAALKAARMVRADAQRTLEFQVKQQYMQAGLFRLNLDFVRQVQATALQTADLNRVRYRAGAISESDLAKADTASLEADQQVDLATQALRAAKISLAFLLGVRGRVPEFSILAENLRYTLPQALSDATPDTLLQVALSHRPDLRAAGFQRQRAQASIDLARRANVPDIGVSVQFAAQGTGNQSLQPPTVTAGLSATVPLFYQHQGEIQKARADNRQQTVQYAKQLAQVTADVETGYGAFAINKGLVNRMEGQLLDRAKRSRDLVELQYRKGAASLLEYLDAQRTYIATNVEYFQDLTNYWTAVFQLEQAVGTELR